MPPKGLMLILSAPSGTGKTTLARRLLDTVPDGLFSVSVTTRPPRGQERNGVDYYFVDAATFDGMVAEDAFLEWAEVHGNRYGTPRRPTLEAIGEGRVVVFDIDVQGGKQILARHPDAASVFVLPPSLSELERRLRGRGTDDEAVVRRRLASARAEIAAGLGAYRHAIVNEDVEKASADLVALVRSLRGQGDAEDDARTRRLLRSEQDLSAFLGTADG